VRLNETDVRLRIEKGQRLRERITIQFDIGIEHQVLARLSAPDCEIVATTIADVALAGDDGRGQRELVRQSGAVEFLVRSVVDEVKLRGLDLMYRAQATQGEIECMERPFEQFELRPVDDQRYAY
jgi:hypothetical protein